MSLYPPPREDEAIFNPVNWEESPEGGLTQQQADQRYLFKTQNDTETGLITFTTGMNIDNIQSFTGNIAIGTSGTANTITIGSANSNVFIYGNVTAIDVQNLVVKDKAITVNKDGISPLGAGLEVESSNVIVSSLLCDASGDWVISSGNNKIYVDEISEKTIGHDVVFSSGISMNGQTLDMTGGEIHKVTLIHGENNSNIIVESRGTGNLNLGTNNIERLTISSGGNVLVTSTTESTSASTGSLRTLGGLGVAGNVFVGGNLTISQSFNTTGDTGILGNLSVSKNLTVTGESNVSGNAIITRNLTVSGESNVSGNARITRNLTVSGESNVIGNINIIQGITVGTNANVTGAINSTGVITSGTGVGTTTLNTQNILLMGSSTSGSGLVRFTRDSNINYLQSALTAVSGNGAPLIISPYASTERWMTITRTGTMIGNTVSSGVVPPANLYILGNALISSNLTVQSNITATARLDAPTSIIGNSSVYGVFLNTSIGVGNIGVSIENSGSGNTIIQPQHQGTAWRNTYLNPNGGLVTIGSATPPNATDELYVNGSANINGSLFIVNDANVLNQTVRGNLTVLGNVTSSPIINGDLFVSGNANIRQNANIGGILRIESTQGTFATGNGALVVSGGVGIGGDINMGGNVNAGGALISAKNTSDALQIIGGGTMTGTMVANQFTGNNVVSGNLLIGGGGLSEGVKCCIRNNVIDTSVNNTTTGNAINLIEFENGTRSFFLSSAGASQDQFYIGSSGGNASADPDMLIYLDTSGRMVNFSPVGGLLTAPNATDLYTCRGNANISANLTVVGNSIVQTGFYTTGTIANICQSNVGRKISITTNLNDSCYLDFSAKDGSTQAYDARIAVQNGNASATGRATVSIVSNDFNIGTVAHQLANVNVYANESDFHGNINFDGIKRSILTDVGQRTLNAVSSVEWTDIPDYAREIKIVYKSDVRSAVADIRFEAGTPASYQTTGYEVLAYRDGGFSDYLTIAIPTFTATYPINTDSYHELTIKLIGTQVSGSTSRNVYTVSGKTYYNDAGTRRGCEIMGIFNTPYTTTADNNFYISRMKLFVTAGTFNDTAGNSFARLYWN